jgi:3-methyladenine DNA glycosylase AlkD
MSRARALDARLLSTPVVLAELHAHAEPSRLEGMARVGIRTERALGVSIPGLRSLAKRIGVDHRIASELWATGIHEARILASMIEDPGALTEDDMDLWAGDFDSWDVCDQVCGNLFDRTPFAYAKAFSWSDREPEFVKRAAFSLMACLAVRDRDARDADLASFLPVIERAATDDRNAVKKGVNWALRQIGKRSPGLNRRAVAVARRLRASESRSARWIGSDAVRELTSEPVQRRLAAGSPRPSRGP